MSTVSTPGRPSQPASGWYPPLNNLGLPTQLTNGIQQGFTLIYSLRDTVNQLQATVSKLVQYGSSQNRQNTNAQAMPDAALWFETDTGKIYQARLNSTSNLREWIAV